mmetsp:Transcript_4872/g.9506  ORF Transcript_4872/g.9506 Transcript_4872/m.9506 type:complete len:85 (-) Transcript_4872:8-262(-)
MTMFDDQAQEMMDQIGDRADLDDASEQKRWSFRSIAENRSSRGSYKKVSQKSGSVSKRGRYLGPVAHLSTRAGTFALSPFSPSF